METALQEELFHQSYRLAIWILGKEITVARSFPHRRDIDFKDHPMTDRTLWNMANCNCRVRPLHRREETYRRIEDWR